MTEVITFSYHAQVRLSQRAITKETILLALQYGRVYHRHGLIFVCVASRDLVGKVLPSVLNRLKNLVVVYKDGVILTAYRTSSPFSKVRKKSKRYHHYTEES